MTARYGDDDLALLKALALQRAREDYWYFRRWINPDMLTGWWQRDVARHLMAFDARLELGARPVMLLQCHPQAGKSRQIVEYLAWRLGRKPDTLATYASFSERLGKRANAQLRRIMSGTRYREVFPDVRFATARDTAHSAGATLLEIPGHDGAFRNTTVRGAITGEGFGLGVLDDPVKGRAEVSSERNRDVAWEWFTDDFYSRFSEDAGLIAIATCWHTDDVMARLEQHFPEATILKYKAIAEEDEPHRKAGEAMFPELKSLEFLEKRRATMRPDAWESLYQQAPYVREGGMFPRDRWQVSEAAPSPDDIAMSVRGWDQAGTLGGSGARTAGVLMHKLKSGGWVVADVVTGRWAAAERRAVMRATAERDGRRVKVWIEQEPGSGGLESAQATISHLRGFTVRADRPTGDKALRADPFASQQQIGNITVLAREWTAGYISEHETFPNGKLKDQVDASALAYSKLAGTSGWEGLL